MFKTMTPEERGLQLESLDHIETAVELLRASGLAFILYVGTHERATTIESGLNEPSAEMLKRWVDSGFFEQITLEHLRRFYPDL